MSKQRDIEKEFLSNIIEDKKHPTRKKGINSKQKGNSFERIIAKVFSERFNRSFARTVSSGAYTGGKNVKNAEVLSEEQLLIFASDIRCPKDFAFSIECKSYKALDFYDLFNESSNLFSWYEQSERDAKLLNKEPLLIVKTNQHKPIVFVEMDYLIKHPCSDKKPVFIHKCKACFWLEDLLTFSDSFFFIDGQK